MPVYISATLDITGAVFTCVILFISDDTVVDFASILIKNMMAITNTTIMKGTVKHRTTTNDIIRAALPKPIDKNTLNIRSVSRSSLVQRLMITPIGVESKNDIGLLNTLSIIARLMVFPNLLIPVESITDLRSNRMNMQPTKQM